MSPPAALVETREDLNPLSEQGASSKQACYLCGPVRLQLVFGEPSLHDALDGLLSQYDAPWPAPSITFRAAIEISNAPPGRIEPSGAYLRLLHLRVDRQDSRLISRSSLGVWMELDLAGEARILVPPPPHSPALVEELEQQLVLLLARAWAQAGWTPLHAGSLFAPGGNRCALLCAPSGIGKTTLIAALLRRGWRTLGDDKLLLRMEGGQIIARALAHRFHLHPSLSRWFPETGDIRAYPTYSRWTDKRVVRIERIWPGRLAERAVPAAAIQLERDPAGPALAVEPLDQTSMLNTLLRQVVIPADREHARPLVACLAAGIAQMRGARIRVGQDAFADSAAAVRLEEELRRLLA